MAHVGVPVLADSGVPVGNGYGLLLATSAVPAQLELVGRRPLAVHGPRGIKQAIKGALT